MHINDLVLLNPNAVWKIFQRHFLFKIKDAEWGDWGIENT